LFSIDDAISSSREIIEQLSEGVWFPKGKGEDSDVLLDPEPGCLRLPPFLLFLLAVLFLLLFCPLILIGTTLVF